eukprot:403369405
MQNIPNTSNPRILNIQGAQQQSNSNSQALAFISQQQQLNQLLLQNQQQAFGINQGHLLLSQQLIGSKQTATQQILSNSVLTPQNYINALVQQNTIKSQIAQLQQQIQLRKQLGAALPQPVYIKPIQVVSQSQPQQVSQDIQRQLQLQLLFQTHQSQLPQLQLQNSLNQAQLMQNSNLSQFNATEFLLNQAGIPNMQSMLGNQEIQQSVQNQVGEAASPQQQSFLPNSQNLKLIQHNQQPLNNTINQANLLSQIMELQIEIEKIQTNPQSFSGLQSNKYENIQEYTRADSLQEKLQQSSTINFESLLSQSIGSKVSSVNISETPELQKYHTLLQQNNFQMVDPSDYHSLLQQQQFKQYTTQPLRQHSLSSNSLESDLDLEIPESSDFSQNYDKNRVTQEVNSITEQQQLIFKDQNSLAEIFELDEKIFSRKLRRDVILKNLLRDVRKYYSQDLNRYTNYHKKKRSNVKTVYIECVDQYVKNRIDPELLSRLGIQHEEMVFILGSLIQPKRMLILDKLTPERKAEIQQIHKTLYQYRNQYLDEIIKYSAVVFLIAHYFKVNQLVRIKRKTSKPIDERAYIVASQKLIMMSPHFERMNSVMNLNLERVIKRLD